MIGRTPGSIVTVRPLKDGVIADFDVTTSMLTEFIHKAIGKGFFSVRELSSVSLPALRQWSAGLVRDAAEQAGAKRVSIIEEPMAAAIGAGLPVAEPQGSMVVDIGGGYQRGRCDFPGRNRRV